MMDGGMHLGGPGLGGLVMLAAFAAALVIPFWRILPRAGLSPWLALVSVLPFAALVLLWVLAFRRWPGDAEARS